ncbi:unnamed protein product [Danaus chrysippus]|uniref:(African queen) hypothetical protein n=1 Tax=Danaus chrysippus TaxID=151541 RepID=A0A8J2QTS8_9NEOP|nr:unnamed protein product [Danaus chrysippus]
MSGHPSSQHMERVVRWAGRSQHTLTRALTAQLRIAARFNALRSMRAAALTTSYFAISSAIPTLLPTS